MGLLEGLRDKAQGIRKIAKLSPVVFVRRFIKTGLCHFTTKHSNIPSFHYSMYEAKALDLKNQH
jgi:hypothetical protein